MLLEDIHKEVETNAIIVSKEWLEEGYVYGVIGVARKKEDPKVNNTVECFRSTVLAKDLGSFFEHVAANKIC